MSRKSIIVVLAAALSLGACYQKDSNAQSSLTTTPTIDQNETCFFRDLGINRNCNIGQKAIMLPDEQYAREELSLLFVARYCDLRYSVVANSRGVACIFYPEKIALRSEAELDSAAQAAAEAAAAAEKALNDQP